MDFAKLLRDAFRETIGFVGACAFYLVAPLRWPTRWAERVSDPTTPSMQGYLETRLFFFLSVAAWIVFIHVFLPAPGIAPTSPTGAAIDAQRQQILDSFIQAFAGGVRGAAATGLVLGAVVATAILDAWLRLRGKGRASDARIDLIVVALGTMNVYVFAIARIGAYVGKDGLAGVLAAIARTAVEMEWPRPIEMALTVGSGGVTRNLVLVCVLAVLASLHVAMAWVLLSPLRIQAGDATVEATLPRVRTVPLALGGFAAVCVGLLAAEAIREGQPRLGEFALLTGEEQAGARSCFIVATLVNDGERPLLLTRSQYIDLRARIGGAERPQTWSPPIDFSAGVAKMNGKAEDGVLVRPGETVLIATTALRPVRPAAPPADSLRRGGAAARVPVTLELWLGGGERVLRLAPVLRSLDSVACLFARG